MSVHRNRAACRASEMGRSYCGASGPNDPNEGARIVVPRTFAVVRQKSRDGGNRVAGTGTAVPRGPLTDARAESGFARANDGLTAIFDIQLGEDARDVIAYRLFAQAEMGRSLRVVSPLCDQFHQLTLAWR